MTVARAQPISELKGKQYIWTLFSEARSCKLVREVPAAGLEH